MRCYESAILRESMELVRQHLGRELEDMTAERVVFGLSFSGVKLSTGQGGLCFTPVKEIPQAVCCPSSAKATPSPGRLKGRPVKEYLDDILGDNVLRRTLDITVLNVLSTAVWEREVPAGYEVLAGMDAFDQLEVENYPKTVVVGVLVPTLKKLMAASACFHVLEQDPRTLKEREPSYYASVDQAGVYVSEAGLTVIMGVTILNDTLLGLLDMAKSGAQILVTSLTASTFPDAFLSRGVAMLDGTHVTRADELLDIISEGGSGYHFFGKYADRTVITKKGEDV